MMDKHLVLNSGRIHSSSLQAKRVNFSLTHPAEELIYRKSSIKPPGAAYLISDLLEASLIERGLKEGGGLIHKIK